MTTQYPLVRWQAGQRAKSALHAIEQVGTWTATLCGVWVTGPVHGPAVGAYGDPTCRRCLASVRSRASHARCYTGDRQIAAVEQDG